MSLASLYIFDRALSPTEILAAASMVQPTPGERLNSGEVQYGSLRDANDGGGRHADVGEECAPT